METPLVKTLKTVNFMAGRNDIMGDKYRRPEKYGILSDVNVKGVIGGEFVHW